MTTKPSTSGGVLVQLHPDDFQLVFDTKPVRDYRLSEASGSVHL